MGMRGREFQPLIPGARNLVLPARGSIASFRPSERGLGARRMLSRKTDVESAVVGTQISLSGQSDNAREQSLMNV